MAHGTAPSNLWTCKYESMDWVRVWGSLSVLARANPPQEHANRRDSALEMFLFKKYQKCPLSEMPHACHCHVVVIQTQAIEEARSLNIAFLKHPDSINLVPSRYWSCGLITFSKRNLMRWNGAGWEVPSVLVNGLDDPAQIHQAKTALVEVVWSIYRAKLLRSCKVLVCVKNTVCGIYTHWLYDSGLDFWCVRLRHKHVLFAGLSIKDLRFLTQRDMQPTWDSLHTPNFSPELFHAGPTNLILWGWQSRNVHSIPRLE